MCFIFVSDRSIDIASMRRNFTVSLWRHIINIHAEICRHYREHFKQSFGRHVFLWEAYIISIILQTVLIEYVKSALHIRWCTAQLKMYFVWFNSFHFTQFMYKTYSIVSSIDFLICCAKAQRWILCISVSLSSR